MAWKLAGADQYVFWNTYSSGNELSISSVMSATSASLKAFETSFVQDLNGDGRVGNSLIVNGTNGNDTLTSSAANEVFFGNGGANTFVFSGITGNDTIADFHPTQDVVQLHQNAFATFADVLAHAAQVGSDVVITADASNSITLHNTAVSQLTNTNVHLV